MSRLIRELRRRAFPLSRAAAFISLSCLTAILAFAWLHLRADYYSDDSDYDGLYNYEEDLIGTDIWNDDSDYDGWLDGEEYWGGWDPLDSNSNPGGGGGDGGSGGAGEPMDSDSDGLSDEDEINTYGTNPNESDSDFDSFSDYDEIFVLYSDPNNSSDPDSSSSSGGDGSGSGSGDSSDSSDSGGDSSGSGGDGSDSGSSDSGSDSGGDSGSTPEISSGLPDSDGDGLSDAFELAHGGDPNDPIEGQTDSDGDGLPDLWEQVYPTASDPGGDTDGDALDNLNEFHYQTNPAAADTDDDGVNDGDEVYGTVFWPGDPMYDYYAEPYDPYGTEVQEEIVFRTDPTNPDTDFDELPDGYELANGYNPLDPSEATFDEDGDGLLLPLEYELGTVDWNADSDGDGMPDKWEHDHGLDPATNDGAEDPDHDGLVNVLEYQNGTLPLDPDTDDDGIRDGAEVANDLDPNNAADGADADTDGDGLQNGFEVFFGLDPNNSADGAAADTDGDGATNGEEQSAGSDPTNKDSTAATPRPHPSGSTAESPDNDNETPSPETVVVNNESNSPKLYPGQTVIAVITISSAEYPEYTDPSDPDHSQWNDEVGWKITYDGETIAESGPDDETSVNDLHDDFEASEAAGHGPFVKRVVAVVTNNSDTAKEVVTEARVVNVDDNHLSTQISIDLIPIVIKSISFSGNGYQELRSIDGTIYSAPHWTDGNGDGSINPGSDGDVRAPFSLSAKSTPTIQADFEVNGVLPPGTTINVKASGHDLTIPDTALDAAHKLAATASTTELKDEAGVFDGADIARSFALQWEIKVGPLDFKDGSKTHHTVYQTAKPPGASAKTNNFETVYYHACRAAPELGVSWLSKPAINSKSSDYQIAYSVFLSFTTDMRCVEPGRAKEGSGAVLGYWKNKPEFDRNAAAGIDVEYLLAHQDGRCEGWVWLLDAAFQVHGLVGKDLIINPTPVAAGKHIDWATKFVEELIKVGKYDHETERLDKGLIKVVPGLAIKEWNGANDAGGWSQAHGTPNDLTAQGNMDPWSHFLNHTVIEAGGKIWDPSYKKKFDNTAAWRSEALQGESLDIKIGIRDSKGKLIRSPSAIWIKP